MDGAYFVSKNDILGWLNQLLGLNYTKVEQCANGAAYCQVFDAIYPGEVPVKKVVFEAKAEHEAEARSPMSSHGRKSWRPSSCS